MGCCGQRRQAHKAWLQPRPVRVRYTGEGPRIVRGQVTGRTYSCSEVSREFVVEAADARALLQDADFVPAASP